MNRGIDLFCGAGGLTRGMEASGMISVVIAVNHWLRAVQTHQANHPHTRHLCQSVDSLDPTTLTNEMLNVLLAAPECTNHCIAKGGRPYDPQSRATAWHVVKFADCLRPDWIVVENVREFGDWGPLFDFRSLTDSGIDWEKEASGATKRKLRAEIQDWEKHRDLFGFDPRALNEKEYKVLGRPIKQRKGQVFRAWMESLRALGYHVEFKMLNAADYGAATTRKRLFVLASRRESKIRWPEPMVAEKDWKPASSIIDWSLPCPSIFTRKKPLADATLRRIEAGIRKFWGEQFEPFIVTMYGQSTAHSIHRPLGTVATGNKHALIEPFLVKLHGTGGANSIRMPLGTVTAGGMKHALVQPFLIKYHSGHGRKGRAHPVGEPLRTVDTSNRFGLVQPFLVAYYGTGRSYPVDEPLKTVTTKDRFALVEPFLVSVNHVDSDGGRFHDLTKPLKTVTTKNGFALVSPDLKGTDCKDVYALDIGLRMLAPHELAAAMGFPKDYQIVGSIADQVKQIGNAVPPPQAEALARAMFC